MVVDKPDPARKKKKSINYVERLKLAKKSKKTRTTKKRREEKEGESSSTPDVETQLTYSDRKPDIDQPDSSPRKNSNSTSSASSFYSLSLRLDDPYSSSKLSDPSSDIDEPVRVSIHQTLFHSDKKPAVDRSVNKVNESVRWELALDSPDDEMERLRVYKLNRRKRYLAKRHLMENENTTMELKMAGMDLSLKSPRK